MRALNWCSRPSCSPRSAFSRAAGSTRAPGNNCFGIKWYAGAPGRQLLATTEWLTTQEYQQFLRGGDGRTADLVMPVEARGPRRKFRVLDWFATFPDLAGCFAKRAALFAVGPYKLAAIQYGEDRDLPAYIRAIGPIYATAPGYADEVLKIIRQGDVRAAILLARGSGIAT